MSVSVHDDVVSRIGRALEAKGYRVRIRGNNLPLRSSREQALYRPDIMATNPADDEIAWIVEVETSDAGKAVLGAAALADICLKKEIEKGHQREKPWLLFVFYRPSANLGLARRLDELKSQGRIRHLQDIYISDENEALETFRSET